MSCSKQHTNTDIIVKDLPINQGGVGRHKCASCAYEKGFENGKEHIFEFDVITFIQNLPESQKGLRRHRDAEEAYELGFYHGQVEAGNNLTIQNKKGIAFSMRNYGLSIIAKSIVDIFKDDNLPYGHATNVVNVAHGFEIVTKARIVEQHPLLIFDKISNNEKIKDEELQFEDLLENGKTIQYSKLPYQIWATSGYKISNLEIYKKLGEVRNQIIHFHVPMELSLVDIVLEYAFKVVEQSINDWWEFTVFKYIKIFDRNIYNKLFKKLNVLNIKTLYEFDEKKGYKRIQPND